MTLNSTPDPFGAIPIAGEKETGDHSGRETDSLQETAEGLAESPSRLTSRKTGKPGRPMQRRRSWRSLLARLAFLPAAGLAIYLLAGYLLAPHLLRTILPGYLSRITERPVTIGAAAFNPLTLSIALQNGIVGAKPGDPADQADPLLSFSRLELEVAAASLVRFGLICRKVDVERVFVHLVRREDNSYNLQDFLHSLGGGKLISSGGMRFSLNNITVSDSRLIFDDRPAGKSHAVEEINLALPILANLAFRPDQYLNPRFSARINGSPVDLTGETRADGGEITARLKLRLAQIDLPSYFAYLPLAANFQPAKGMADLDLEIVFHTGVPGNNRLQIEGSGRLTDVWLQTAEGKEIGRLPAVTGIFSFAPLGGKYRLKEMGLQQPEILLERLPDGQWLYPRLAMDAEGVEIDRLLVTAGRLSFIDRRVKGGFADSWSELQLSIEGYNGRSSKPAAFALSGRNREQARLSAQGRLLPDQGAAEGMLIGHHLQLVSLSPYLNEEHPFRLQGEIVQIETGFNVSKKKNAAGEFSCSGMTARLENLSLERIGKPWLNLPRLMLEDVSLRWPDRRLMLGKARMAGGALLLDFDQEGNLGWAAGGKSGGSKTEGWQFTARELNLEETAILLRTRAFAEPLALDFLNGRLSLAGLTNQPGKEGRFNGSFEISGESPVELAGELQLAPFAARLEGRIENMAIKRLQPLFSGWFRPSIQTGELRGAGELRLPGPVFRGALQIHQFAAVHGRKEILRWQRAASEDITIQLAPGILKADNLLLEQPFAAWNLAGKAGSAMSDLLDLSWTSGREPRISLGRLRIVDGELAVTDSAASPPYATRISAIHGVIDSLVSTAEGRSRIALEGGWPGGAVYSVRGVFNPFGPIPVAELNAEARNFELAGLSPYLSEQLGHRLAGGNLALSGSISLHQQRLRASNRLQVAGLQLGESLGRGSNLPLTLALLSDREGKVDLSIPIEAHTDAPDFSYREELRRGVRHLLLKSAVSPFSVLAESTSNSGMAEYFTFPYGRMDLAPEVQTQLRQLAAAMSERPRLRLLLHGFADEDHDRNAIKLNLEAEERSRELARESQVSDRLAAAYRKEEIASLPQGASVRAEMRPIVVSDEMLKDLAAGRGEAIQHFLTVNFGIPATRVAVSPAVRTVPAGAPGRSGNRVDIELQASGARDQVPGIRTGSSSRPPYP